MSLSIHPSSSSYTRFSLRTIFSLGRWTHTNSVNWPIMDSLSLLLKHLVTLNQRYICIMLPSFWYKLVHSSLNIPIGIVFRSTMIHWPLSTIKYSIFSFHISKFLPLIFFISIFNLLTISFHHNNQFSRSPILTWSGIGPSQTP